jgi:vitamin B12 transporter
MMAATLPATVAIAQDDADDEVIVVGERLEETLPQELERFGNRLETVDADDIELGGFNDLSQTMQMQVPAFFVAPKNGPFDYIQCSLQGSRCEDVLFLVDGVRIANRLYNTTTPLDTLPSHSVERIEVLYGGQGIFYGTQSVAGVVNIVTSSFAGESGGAVDIGFDENDGTHVSAEYRTGSGNHGVVLYVSQDEADGFQPFADQDYQPSGTLRERSYDSLTFGAKYAYDFSADSRLSLLYQRTDNELDFALPYQVATAFNARVEDLFTAKWDYAVGDNVDFYVKAYFHDWDTEYTDIRNDIGAGGTLPGTQTVVYDAAWWGFEDYGITALASIHAGSAVDFSVGYDYQRFWGGDQVWLIEDKTETAQAVYGQIRSSETAFENSDVAFGLRYNTTSGTFDGTVWNLSGRHNITDSFFLRGQVGTSFRLPDAEELYLRDCCEVGNPNLEPEESENFEVGIGGSKRADGGLQWQLIYFTRDVDNLIDIDFDNPAYPDGIFANFDQTVEFEGWEIDFNAALTQTLSLGASYTLNDANIENSSDQFNRVPETLLKLDLRFEAMQAPLELNFAVVDVGDTFDTIGGGVGRVRYGDYTLVDVSGAYYLDADRKHRLGVRLENALDEDYATSLGRGRFDVNNASYAYRNLGAPRTLNASYSYRW